MALAILPLKSRHGRNYKTDVREILGVGPLQLADESIFLSESGPYAAAAENAVIARLDSLADTLTENPRDLYFAALYALAFNVFDVVKQTDVKTERGPDFSIERNLDALMAYKNVQIRGAFCRHMDNLGIENTAMPVIEAMPGTTGAIHDRPDGS